MSMDNIHTKAVRPDTFVPGKIYKLASNIPHPHASLARKLVRIERFVDGGDKVIVKTVRTNSVFKVNRQHVKELIG